MCSVPDTMILRSSGFTGSVTQAWRMWVVIGTSIPARRPTSVDQPDVHEITVPAEIAAAVRLDARHLPLSRVMPVTSV